MDKLNKNSPYLAHIAKDGREQTLEAHLCGTAKLSEECLRNIGLADAAYLAGLLHDAGKGRDEFQRYLRKMTNQRRGSVIHTFQGCKFLLDRYHRGNDDFYLFSAELLAFAVAAHHGLFDCVEDSGRIGLKYRDDKQNMGYEEAMRTFFTVCADTEELDQRFARAAAELTDMLRKMVQAYADETELSFAVGLLARLLLSAVIEGDRQNTAVFENGAVFPKFPDDMQPLWRQRLAFMEKALLRLPNDGAINRARREISDQCASFASQASGIYRLNVPTGSGKTLSSLRYALRHAAEHNKKRLFFLSPLLTILEQNAKIIRDYVGDDSLILEHHSNVVQTDEESQEQLDERELLVETWNAPIVITTMVQFLNTLFSGKAAAIRRFHSLCDSVIVIDEVQTVPAKLLSMFNMALRFLSGQCKATILLCSATQPTLELAARPLPQRPPDIVPYDPALWKPFARTALHPLDGRRLDELPALIRELMEQKQSLLVVCNKKREAAFLLEQTRDERWSSFHLSAGMCMQHRRETLAELEKLLAPKSRRQQKVLCVSTQVIEAGVDISFSCVLRLSAGMDSVIQSAGRCNRSGEDGAIQPVYLVNCTDESLDKLEEIKRGKQATGALLEAFAHEPERFAHSLLSDAAVAFYYKSLYGSMAEGLQDYTLPREKCTLFDLLSLNQKYADETCEGLDEYRLVQAFQTAGRAFSVFDEDTVDVLVPYQKEGKDLIAELCSHRAVTDAAYRQELLKQAAAYSVSLYRGQWRALERQGAIYSVCGDCVSVLRDEFYDKDIGVSGEAKPQTYWEA